MLHENRGGGDDDDRRRAGGEIHEDARGEGKRNDHSNDRRDDRSDDGDDKRGKRNGDTKKLSSDDAATSSTSEVMMPKAEPKLLPYETRVVPTRREDLVKFILLPPYRGVNKRIRCYIKRHKSMTGKQTYSFWLEPNDGGPSRNLMYACKKGMTNKTTYLISLDKDDMGKSYNDRSKWYLGKLQSKGRDTNTFYVYDRGMNSEDLMLMERGNSSGGSGSSSGGLRQSAARRELAAIAYNRGAQFSHSRRIEVGLPAIVRDDGTTVTEAQFRPFSDADSLMTVFNNIRSKGQQNVVATKRILALHNKAWSAGKTSELGQFDGRATESSTKNFQLCVSPPSDPAHRRDYDQTPMGQREKIHPERVILQMGRCVDRFNVDFTYPMSFFTAFAVCLSRFATKASDAF